MIATTTRETRTWIRREMSVLVRHALGCIAFAASSIAALSAQGAFLQGSANQAGEYIESSSPLPGGGVVTTVIQKGAIGPAIHIPNPDALAGGTANGATSVLEKGAAPAQPLAGVRLAQDPGVAANQPPALAPPVQGWTPTPQQTVVTGIPQVPVLGVPVEWDRSLRPGPGCFGCWGNRTVSRPVYAPGVQAGVAPPPASLPPALPAPGQTVFSPAPAIAPVQQVYSPVVQLQNLPPGTYIGQGIIGSPKAYVDGQPIRNLLRYLILP